MLSPLLYLCSDKHQHSKDRLACKEACEQDIANALKKHNEETHLKEETPPEEQQVVTAFPSAAVRLNKYACFRDVLEKGAYWLMD